MLVRYILIHINQDARNHVNNTKKNLTNILEHCILISEGQNMKNQDDDMLLNSWIDMLDDNQVTKETNVIELFPERDVIIAQANETPKSEFCLQIIMDLKQDGLNREMTAVQTHAYMEALALAMESYISALQEEKKAA